MPPTPEANREVPNRNEDDESEVSSVESPQFIIAAGSSDEGEDEDAPSGYQMLPQDPDTAGEEDDNSEDDSYEGAVAANASETPSELHSITPKSQSHMDVPPIKQAEVIERQELWKVRNTNHEPMPDDQVDKIKSIMQNITLPKMNIPPWARIVPEDDWKARVMNTVTKPSNNKEINQMQESDRDNAEKLDNCTGGIKDDATK